MKNLILGIILGIFLSVFSFNIMPYLYSQASSSDIRNIVRELREIKNHLHSIDKTLKQSQSPLQFN